jgi:hypothetical protein
MKLDLQVNYVLQLNPIELGLVSAALRGVLKDDQKEAASELQAKIMETKVTASKAFMHEIEKLEKNIKGG